MRKPIAITTACGFSPECGTMSSTIALCDDGTMWGLDGRQWNELPPIPQDAQEVKP
jgi:hypothetical protein